MRVSGLFFCFVFFFPEQNKKHTGADCNDRTNTFFFSPLPLFSALLLQSRGQTEKREAEALLQESVRTRDELKTRAQEAVRQWRAKCRRLQKELEDARADAGFHADKASQVSGGRSASLHQATPLNKQPHSTPLAATTRAQGKQNSIDPRKHLATLGTHHHHHTDAHQSLLSGPEE